MSTPRIWKMQHSGIRFLVVLVLLLGLALLGRTAQAAEEKPSPKGSPKAKAEAVLEEKWGIRPVSIRLTGADHFIDFRYRVVDPDKAAALMDRQAKPYLLDQASGKVIPVSVTKLGPMRASGTKPQPGRNYVIMFTNAEKRIKPGSRVTLVIGDFKAQDLKVESGSARRVAARHQKEWENIQKKLGDELNVCIEHCGSEETCLDKCEEVHGSRLDKEFQRLGGR